MEQKDGKDYEILDHRLSKWNENKGPRVGDWCLMLDGTERRFTHDWGDSIQTTYSKQGGGSFYLGDGYMSYSGSLDPAIQKDCFQLTRETRNARVWFFHHDFWGAGRGVEFTVPCRVYQQRAA